jgi:hypothetical protein
VLSETDNDYNRNESDNDNSVTMSANARNNSVGQTHSNLKVLKTRKKRWFMCGICVKTKLSGMRKTGYAQMVEIILYKEKTHRVATVGLIYNGFLKLRLT